jgi:hypothetical protein
MQNGFRVPAQASKKEKVRSLETEVQNLKTSIQITQMMTKQLMDNIQGMANDLQNAMNQMYEMQYKYTAIKENLNLDSTVLDGIANGHRLTDFEAASILADKKENLEQADTATEDSTVTITSVASSAEGKDMGIFRSRLKLIDCGVPALITELTGKTVGDRVTVQLNNLDHLVELLAIRNPKKELVAIVPEIVEE